MKVNIIILNYNGKRLMAECLPSIIAASNNSRHNCTLTVLDNKSTDGSIEFLKENFPDIKIYKAKENKIYCSYNEIAKTIEDDIMIILNNDIKIDKGYIDPLIEPFLHDKDILFTAPKGYSFDGERYEGDKAKVAIRWGIIEPAVVYDGYKKDIDSEGYTFSAGVGAFDRKKFIQLGGYDDIYLPGRYEDVDLCYRGWKKGWKGKYQPRSIQYHKGGASFKKKYKDKQIAKTVFRNSIIFMLKNIADTSLLLQFSLLTALRTILYLLIGKFHMVGGYFDALRRLPAIITRRKANTPLWVLSDKEVLKIVNGR